MDFQRLLVMFQLVDSNFPMGTFAQSFGLETAVQERRITDAPQLLAYLQHYLIATVAPMEGRALQMVYNWLEETDAWQAPEWCAVSIRHLDRLLVVQRMARESREGMVKVGKRYLDMLLKLHPLETLRWYQDSIRQKQCHGHPAIVHALAMHGLGLSRAETLLSYFYSSLNAQVANGVRLVPLGQTDGQLILQRLFPHILEQVRKLEEHAKPSIEDLCSSGLHFELDAMRHEQLYSRLFMS